MYRLITGMLLIQAILIVIPLQGFAATPKETVETGVNKVLRNCQREPWARHGES